MSSRALLLIAALSAVSGCSRARGRFVEPSFDGVKVVYEVFGERSPTLVFVHGWACDRSHWHRQVVHFDRTHRTVTLDLPGHGESGGERRKTWSLPALARDVESVVRRVDGPVVLVGHSMGGAVCLLAARRLGDQVRGVVAVDALHDVERQLTAEEVAQMVRPFEADFPGACELFVRKMFPRNSDSAVVESTIAATRRTSPEAGIALIRSHVTFSTRDALADCPAPVHCINSVAMDTEIERNRRYSTQFGVTLMTEVGHFPMLERPHEFNRHLETVLARLSAESID